MGVSLVNEAASYKSISASENTVSGQGRLLGFLCTSSSAGTVKLWDSLAASGNVISDTMSVLAGVYYPVPASFATGLYATIGGTATITLFYDKN